MCKPYLDVNDIMKIMNCKKSKAYDYIRVIKETSDVGKTRGRVMVKDFNMWAFGNCNGDSENFNNKGEN